MTAKEINAMSPKTLNLEVAIALGWKSHPRLSSWIDPDGIEFSHLPNWTTDDKDAVELLGEIIKRGWDWSSHSLDRGSCNGNAVSFDVQDVSNMDPMIVGGVGHIICTGSDPDNWHWPSSGKTFAEAVCRAFLLACHETKKKP